MHLFRTLLTAVAVLLATGCSAPEPGAAPAERDTLEVAGASAGTGPADPGAAAAPTAQAPNGEPSPPEAPAAEAPSGEALPSAQDPGLAARLDAILAEQRAIQARLDSLAARVADGGVPPRVDSAAGGGGVRTGQPAEVLDEARSQVQNFGVGVLWSIVVVFVFNYLIHAAAWVLDVLSERSARRRLFFKGLVPIVRMVLWLFAGYLIVRVIFQVDAQGVIAGAAALGVAVGFAAQDLLKNLFGGIILVFDQPFQVGDKIRVGETYGEVTSIGLRSTRIVTPDDNLVSVPNAQVVDQQVLNANAGELNCQVVIDLYLAGDVDEAQAKEIAYEAAVGSRYVYLNKPIVVLVRDELGRTVFTRVRVKAYVLDPRHEFLFESDVTERARAGFRAAGMMGQERVPPGGRHQQPAEGPEPVHDPASGQGREAVRDHAQTLPGDRA